MYIEQIILKQDENIITEAKDVYIQCNKSKETKYDQLTLTNKRIIAFNYNSDLYLEIDIKDILEKYGRLLCEIVCDEEKIVEYDDDFNELETAAYHYGMLFRTTSGLVKMTFDKSNKKDKKYSKDIINSIFKITNHEIPKTLDNAYDVKSFISGIFSVEGDNIHSLIMESTVPTKELSLKNIRDYRIFEKDMINDHPKVREKYTVICSNCGTILQSDSLYCSNCGIKIETIEDDIDNVYVADKDSLSAAKELFNTIQKIDEQRKVFKKNIFDNIGYENRVEEANRAANRKTLEIIKSYPIPSDIDEILDLFNYVYSNINIKVSRRTFLNNMVNSNTYERLLSDVWIDKLEEIYKIAKCLHRDEDKFIAMKNRYFEIMNELNILN